jgi:DNA-binding NtrC family response regulator
MKRPEPAAVGCSNGRDRLRPGYEVVEGDLMTAPADNGQFVVNGGPCHCKHSDEIVSGREPLQCGCSLPDVVSKNPRMIAIFDSIGRIAHTPTTVLIEGETGTGKELVARAIHSASRERSGALVPVSCAAVPEQLLESELFGHEKGAFTSAVSKRTGRFELAHGGTLLLDEVGDIPAAMQAKLLRVLQERQFERVGGTQTISVDVRVVAATNRCLRQMVLDGTFREDLYYRLNVVRIDLPPLRDRPEDIPLLAAYFTAKYARPKHQPKMLSLASLEALMRYPWPGNIRQLENAIERACIISRGDLVQPDDLPSEVVRPAEGKGKCPIDWSRPLQEVMEGITARIERRYLRKALKRCGGNIGRCALLCGISRRCLGTKLAEYQIDKAEFKNA